MMKQRQIRHIDYQNSSMLSCILQSALPLLAAQILNLLYNIVDRIYIARIPSVGTTAIGAVGLCFPVIILVNAFTNMYGSGGSPLFAIALGEGNTQRAGKLLNLSLRLEILTAAVLTVSGELFCTPVLRLFGASSVTLPYARSYLRIYLLGNLFSMIATGMNPFINAQGFPLIGMVTVTIGALCNILLDPLLIYVFGMGVQGAAIATVFSQALSALFVIRFLTGRTTLLRITFMSWKEFLSSGKEIRNIISLGLSSFVMQVTNSLVSIACNSALAQTGGDLYISIMAIISSIRQIMDTPIFAISDGTSPVVSFNYGARRPDRVKEGIRILTILGFLYTIAAWIFIVAKTELLISIFSSDAAILKEAVPAVHMYFAAFVFQTFQYAGQTTFKSLGKKKRAIFFSLLRKAVIVIPLTYLLPFAFRMGSMGVFMAEPVSNVIGGLACFITMLVTILPELKQMEADASA